MKAAFTKGQVVIQVASVDGKGTFSWSRAIVKSCGKKQMTLCHPVTGAMLGNHFRPEHGVDIANGQSYGVVADMTDEQADKYTMTIAQLYVTRKMFGLEDQLDDAKARKAPVAYVELMEKQFEEFKKNTANVQRG